MKRQVLCLILAAVMIISCFGLTAAAAEAPSPAPILRATGRFNVSVHAGMIARGRDGSFSGSGRDGNGQGVLYPVFSESGYWSD